MSIYQRDPAAPGANVGRRRAVTGESSLARLEGAVGRFNASDAARTVAGLTRSLGQPKVSIGAAAGSSSEVRITVVWDLCWYQWGVDLADESRSVFPLAKGDEIEQVDRSARQWNAVAGGLGQLALAGSGMPAMPKRRMDWLRRQ